MAGSPDLFVVCKNCGSEVSPYITECPYCGQRLRKRAPKLERGEDGTSRPKERRRPPRPTLGRLRPGEMPGIRVDSDARPVVTIALVVLGLFGLLAVAVLSRFDLGLVGAFDGQWWRALTAPFAYVNVWYQLACLLAVAIFGTLLERRHGPVVVLVLWLLCASGAAVVAVEADALSGVGLGGNGGALGLLAAWAVPAVLERRGSGGDDDADLLGVLVLGLLLAAMPLASSTLADPVVGTVGGLLGVVAGLVLSRTRAHRV